MRGKGFRQNLRSAFPRITPAYAGKSRTFAVSCCCIQDHPRLCGEKTGDSIADMQAKGSPPPMRGKVLFFKELERDDRITPAYAGKSRTRNKEGRNIEDHPRLCGEKRPWIQEALRSRGSPPPMRGKVVLFTILYVDFGITPAYAGKSARTRTGEKT